MDTEIVKVKGEKSYNQFGQEVIVCTLCNDAMTTMKGTERCDECWELENRIIADMTLAKKIISRLEKKQ